MALTTNRGFNIPARGGSVGTWDVELRDNATDLDTMLGGVLTTAVSSGSYDISATAYKYGVLRFTGALVGNVVVKLPARSCLYTVDNQTTGVGYYVQFTTSSGDVVAVSQGKSTDIIVDGTNVSFRDAPDPGSFWDWGGVTAPVWIAACTKRPWLVCDGTVYNASDYPHLFAILGGAWGGNGSTTFAVPDQGNRARVPINASPLLTATYAGIVGSARGSCGSESNTLTSLTMPSHYHAAAIYDPGHSHLLGIPTYFNLGAGAGGQTVYATNGPYGASVYANANTTGVRVNSSNGYDTTYSTGSGNPHANVQPTLIHGLSFIKT